MNKKNIQIVVVVICFGIAGVILYKGFFSSGPAASPATVTPKPGVPVSAATSTTPGASPAAATPGLTPGGALGTTASSAKNPSMVQSDKLLPYGSTFNVNTALDQYNFQFGAYQYPVASSSDVGIDLKSLIKPEVKSSNSVLSNSGNK